MVLHSFSACSKVKGCIWNPYMMLCDKLWAITLRTKLLDKNRSGPKCQLWPRQPNLAVVCHKKGGKCLFIPSLHAQKLHLCSALHSYVMLKGSVWLPYKTF